MNLLETIGHNIRTTRKLKGYSQNELAIKCGLTRPTISMIENGQKNSHIMTLNKIAEMLGVDLKDFI